MNDICPNVSTENKREIVKYILNLTNNDTLILCSNEECCNIGYVNSDDYDHTIRYCQKCKKCYCRSCCVKCELCFDIYEQDSMLYHCQSCDSCVTDNNRDGKYVLEFITENKYRKFDESSHKEVVTNILRNIMSNPLDTLKDKQRIILNDKEIQDHITVKIMSKDTKEIFGSFEELQQYNDMMAEELIDCLDDPNSRANTVDAIVFNCIYYKVVFNIDWSFLKY